MEFTNIFENNKKWVADKLSLDPQYFENLSRGQNPELLYIGCSDSRVTAEELMGVQPGEVFVHRNIANMVISIDLNDLDILNPWLHNIRDVYRLHKKELDGFKDENARYNRLIELNVQEQCVRLKPLTCRKPIKKEDCWCMDGCLTFIRVN